MRGARRSGRTEISWNIRRFCRVPSPRRGMVREKREALMVSTRPLLRLGFLLLAAGAQIGTCSSQAVLLDASGGGLVPLLERNAYGPAGPNALIGETARGPVFQPSTAQDHLATHFVQL